MRMRLLVTGATGKVGQALIARLLSDEQWERAEIRALCHNRSVEESERVSIVRGSIAERAVVQAAVAGVTHVIHLATCKETPEDVMDVTVKGLFWLLEAARESPTFRQRRARVQQQRCTTMTKLMRCDVHVTAFSVSF
jgi:uncharacterized protein YbjT (DUF2867 family)